MLEPGQNEQTVQALAGHVRRRMMECYSHIRLDAKLQVVMAIDSSRKKSSGSVRAAQWARRDVSVMARAYAVKRI
jgi:hypothetical protein